MIAYQTLVLTISTHLLLFTHPHDHSSLPNHPVQPIPSPLVLPPPPDPLVLHLTFSSFPPATIAIKFHSYGSPNYPIHVRRLLEHAKFKADDEVAFSPIGDLHPLHYPGEGRTTLDFQPKGGCTWGQWRLVLVAMEDFGEWYQSRDFLFEVRSFDRQGKGEGLGSGILWTGLVSVEGRA